MNDPRKDGNQMRLAVRVSLFCLIAVAALSGSFVVVNAASAPQGSRAYSQGTIAAGGGGITFSGQAFVVGVETRLGLTTFVDTGPLPASGGTLHASLASFSDNESGTQITARALRALTVGEGQRSRSLASLEQLVVDDGMGNIIKADVVKARAEAKCVAGQAVSTSHVRITNLTINGVKQTVTGAVNQIIVVTSVGSGESLLINSVSTGPGSVTVTALEFIQTDLQGISFASVTADVNNCPPRRLVAHTQGLHPLGISLRCSVCFPGQDENLAALSSNNRFD